MTVVCCTPVSVNFENPQCLNKMLKQSLWWCIHTPHHPFINVRDNYSMYCKKNLMLVNFHQTFFILKKLGRATMANNQKRNSRCCGKVQKDKMISSSLPVSSISHGYFQMFTFYYHIYSFIACLFSGDIIFVYIHFLKFSNSTIDPHFWYK